MTKCCRFEILKENKRATGADCSQCRTNVRCCRVGGGRSSGVVVVSSPCRLRVVSFRVVRSYPHKFDGKKQQTFKEAIAKTADETVRVDHVIIDSFKVFFKAARRLLNQGLRIPVRVNPVDKRAADSIAARLTKDSLNVELARAGLPPATLRESATVVQTAGHFGSGSFIVNGSCNYSWRNICGFNPFCWSGWLDCQGFATNQRQISPSFVFARLVGYSL